MHGKLGCSNSKAGVVSGRVEGKKILAMLRLKP